MKQVVSITTDEAVAIVGREKGAMARMNVYNPELIAYHCIIHQSVRFSTLTDEYAEVMSTMMRVINFLRASSPRQLCMYAEFKLIQMLMTFCYTTRRLGKGREFSTNGPPRGKLRLCCHSRRARRPSTTKMRGMDMVTVLLGTTLHLNEWHCHRTTTTQFVT